jgi:tRNA(fMet)-specific endonuclease VapC
LKYLLDTDTLIYISKRAGKCLERLEQHANADIAISSLNIFELEYGISRSSAPARAQRYLAELQARFTVLAFDSDSAAQAGRIRAQLRLAGVPIGPYDLQHAGIALAKQLVFVTRNTREFERVLGLRLENWYD